MSTPSIYEITEKFYPTRPEQTCVLKPYSPDDKESTQNILKIFNIFTRQHVDKNYSVHHGKSFNEWNSTKNLELPMYCVYSDDETADFNIVQQSPVPAHIVNSNLNPNTTQIRNSKFISINGGKIIYEGEYVDVSGTSLNIDDFFGVTFSKISTQHWFFLISLKRGEIRGQIPEDAEFYNILKTERAAHFEISQSSDKSFNDFVFEVTPLNDGVNMPVFEFPENFEGLGLNMVYLNTSFVQPSWNMYYVKKLFNYNFRVPDEFLSELWPNWNPENNKQLTNYAPFWKNYLIDGGVVI